MNRQYSKFIFFIKKSLLCAFSVLLKKWFFKFFSLHVLAVGIAIISTLVTFHSYAFAESTPSSGSNESKVSHSVADISSSKPNNNGDVLFSGLARHDSNIHRIPFRGLTFVYMEAKAGLSDFLPSIIEDFTKKATQQGITVDNIIIMYLDYFDEAPPLYYNHTDYPVDETDDETNKSSLSPNANSQLYDNKNSQEVHNSLLITTDEGLKINLKKCDLNKYGLSFLTFKRRALVGTLISSREATNLTDSTLNTVDFSNEFIAGFQYHSLDYYAQRLSTKEKGLATMQTTSNSSRTRNTHSSKGQSSSESDGIRPSKFPKQVYIPEELIKQRVSILKYANLAKFKSKGVVGVFEMHDLITDEYSYFILPGDLKEFLKAANSKVDSNNTQTNKANNNDNKKADAVSEVLNAVNNN